MNAVFSRPTFSRHDGRYLMRFGRFSLSQSTFMTIAAIAIGVGGGFGAVGFRALIGAATTLGFGVVGTAFAHVAGPAGVIAQLAIGGAFAAFVTARFAPEAKGHGVPEVMEAVAMRGGVMRPRIIGIKAIASAVSIGFGGSCGREGPIVQIGSAIGSVFGQFASAPAPIVRTLVACGAAAGISATFNAPIGGAFFAAEVILGEFAPRSFAAIVVASVVSAVIGRAFLGNTPSFSAAGFMLVSPWELVLYGLLGIVAAVWATGFVKLLYAVEDRFETVRLAAWAKGAIGFAMLGVIGIWFPQVFGVGYGSIQQVFYEHVPALHAIALAALKPLATSLTLGAGGSGGVFAPSLFTGAFLGDAFGSIAHQAFPAWTGPAAAYGLVGMAAVFAAAAEAPLTAIMIVFEMSDDYTIILPLMIAVVIAALTGRKLLGATIYERKLLRRGIDWKRVRNPQFFARSSVSQVMRTPPIIADYAQSISSLALAAIDVAELAYPVCSHGRFVGIVTVAAIARALALGSGGDTVGSIVRSAGTDVSPSESLERAASLLSSADAPLFAVLADNGRLLGIVTRRDVLLAYHANLEVG